MTTGGLPAALPANRMPAGTSPEAIRAERLVSTIDRGRSRPVVVLASDGREYVIKPLWDSKTARRAIGELIAWGVAEAIGLPQPAMTLLTVDAAVDFSEVPDDKRDRYEQSRGLVFGSEFIPDAQSLRRYRNLAIDPDFAATVIWFDSLLVNNDRKARNPNILVAGDQFWVIDNDSALSLHHSWADPARQSHHRFCPIDAGYWWRLKEHCLLPLSGSVESAGERLAPQISQELIERLVLSIPDAWLHVGFPEGSLAGPRDTYVEFLAQRLEQRRTFEREADFLRFHGITIEVRPGTTAFTTRR